MPPTFDANAYRAKLAAAKFAEEQRKQIVARAQERQGEAEENYPVWMRKAAKAQTLGGKPKSKKPTKKQTKPKKKTTQKTKK